MTFSTELEREDDGRWLAEVPSLPGVMWYGGDREGLIGWVQASLEQRQRFQQLFFPEGISFDGSAFVGTAATAPAFSYLREIRTGNERMVAQIFPRLNPLTSWMHLDSTTLAKGPAMMPIE